MTDLSNKVLGLQKQSGAHHVDVFTEAVFPNSHASAWKCFDCCAEQSGFTTFADAEKAAEAHAAADRAPDRVQTIRAYDETPPGGCCFDRADPFCGMFCQKAIRVHQDASRRGVKRDEEPWSGWEPTVEATRSEPLLLRMWLKLMWFRNFARCTCRNGCRYCFGSDSPPAYCDRARSKSLR